MTKLLEKEREFQWSDECQVSFEYLMKRLTSAPILVLLDITQALTFIVMHLVKVWVAC